MDVLFKKAIPFLSLILLVCSAGVQGASPIRLDVNIHTMGGNVRGFGVLAEYSAASPGKVVLTRTTKPGAFEFKPDYGGFSSICSFNSGDGNCCDASSFHFSMRSIIYRTSFISLLFRDIFETEDKISLHIKLSLLSLSLIALESLRTSRDFSMSLKTSLRTIVSYWLTKTGAVSLFRAHSEHKSELMSLY